ncbi:MAG: hypothetical protein JWP13_355 [Candidatus Saccharibacteria bacterium]|nr:hypothetical protein [Candidatus Saccharibacteria bacterium]
MRDMSYYTERIWQFNNHNLGPREGQIILDEATCLSEDSVDFGPLYVTSGLQRRDVIVFLGFISQTDSSPDDTQTGYMVTHVDKDGSGILVAKDLMNRDPASWVNPRTVGLWKALSAEGYGLEDFSLSSLQKHIDTRILAA